MKRRMAASGFLAFFFAGFGVLPQVGRVGFGRLAGLWMLFFAGWGAAAFVLLGRRDVWMRRRAEKRRSAAGRLAAFGKGGGLAVSGGGTDRRLRIIVWAALFVCWLPAWLALFPGVYGYDAPIQMEQFFGYAPLTSHHPVAHTFLLGGFLTAGRLLFGSYNGGLALFTFAQGLVVSHSLACSLVFLRRRGIPSAALALGFAAAAFHPVIQALSFNCTKDVLFGAFLLYFTMAFLESLEGRARAVWPLVLSGVFTCLFRNQGIYILLALLLAVAAVSLRAKRKAALVRTLGCLAAVVLIGEGIFLFFSHGLGIPGTDKREMLSVPMQQAACIANRALSGQEAELTAEELADIERVIPEENIRNYLPVCADPVKSGFRTDVFLEDTGRYIKIWLAVGLKNPGLYLAAFREMIYPYWNMAENPQRELCLENTFPELNYAGISRSSLFPAYESYLYAAVAGLDYNAVPALSWIIQPGLCLWLLTAVLALALRDGDGGLFLGLMPLALYFGTLLLGPVALLRYLYPLVLCTPLLTGFIVGSAGIRDDEKR